MMIAVKVPVAVRWVKELEEVFTTVGIAKCRKKKGGPLGERRVKGIRVP
jgi:hypothetical protein